MIEIVDRDLDRNTGDDHEKKEQIVMLINR